MTLRETRRILLDCNPVDVVQIHSLPDTHVFIGLVPKLLGAKVVLDLLETMPEFMPFRPESMFAHYLMMIGALGEEACTATARQYGAYENSIGTGQVNIWFERPAAGWTAPTSATSVPST